MLFNIVLDSVLRKTNNQDRGVIRWSFISRLEDLDYADVICFLAHSFEDMMQKLVRPSEEVMTVGLKININKTKQLRVNTDNVNPLHIENQPIELVEHFVYLGSVIDKEGGTYRH